MKKKMLRFAAMLLAALILCSCGRGEASDGTSGSTVGSTSGLQSTAPTTAEPVVPPSTKLVEISEEELYDKLVGGWIGQMVGVTWSASTEFRWCGQIIPEGGMDTWSPNMINNGFGQDDIYVEIPFLDAMKENGALCDVKYMADKFRDSEFPLWHANLMGRNNLRAGIEYPDSGHYLYNKCADDIDWQIECDFLGMMYPGLVSASALRSFDIGHIMNYGDGVYGGVFITAMHAAAYTAESIDEIVEAGLAVIPENTQFRSLIEDVIASYEKGDTWEECWEMLEEKWAYTDKCIGGAGNIDAKLNSGYVLMGLLFGEGDFADTIIISCRCGQDSDCNPSSAASILGNFLGADKIEAQYKSALDKTRKFSNTDYTFDEAVGINFDLMKQVLLASGAVCADGVWSIPADASYVPVPWEQWADNFDVAVSLEHIGNGVVDIAVTKHGSDRLSSFTIDMGDGSSFDFGIGRYAYDSSGTYTVTWSAVSDKGDKVTHSRTIEISSDVSVKGTPICSVTAPTGGGSKDMGVMFDGIIPKVGSGDSSQQYDTFTGADAAEKVYAGVEFDGAYTISGVKFTEGKHFKDGGWFDGAPYIEILTDGEWRRIDAEISEAYPENDLASQGESFETYVFDFGAEVECLGVRVCGTPGGSAYFISVGEITPVCNMKNDFDNDIFIPICNVTSPEGGGSKDINVICDGKIGTDSKSQYDTFVKSPGDGESYIGYVFTSEKHVTRIVLTEGKHFNDGGWFRNGKLRLERLVNGVWTEAECEISPDYPTGDGKADFGADFETYSFVLSKAASCDGIRIIGEAGGTARFISVSELAVEFVMIPDPLM